MSRQQLGRASRAPPCLYDSWRALAPRRRPRRLGTVETWRHAGRDMYRRMLPGVVRQVVADPPRQAGQQVPRADNKQVIAAAVDRVNAATLVGIIARLVYLIADMADPALKEQRQRRAERRDPRQSAVQPIAKQIAQIVHIQPQHP